MQQKKLSFSIANQINPNTGEPFGPKYEGSFNIRLASIRDKTLIAQRKAAERNAFGTTPEEQVPEGLELARHIFFFVKAVAIEETPKWFDSDNLYDDDDEAALLQVWQEVQTFQNSFRLVRASGTGE